MPEPALTPFEQELDQAADPIFTGKKTGYAWGPVDVILKAELKLSTVRCKKSRGSGRGANVLTESNDKDYELYVIFIGPNYSRKAFVRAAENRVKRFPNVRTVAIADKPSGGQWRVRSIVERKGVGLAEQISSSFPAVTPSDVHYVEASPAQLEEGGSEGTAAPAVPTVDPDDFASAMLSHKAELTGLEQLPTRFIQFAGEAGVVVDMTTAVDVLASVLASQFVLFAGPSGTGKSTLARQLQHFFSDEDKAQIVEARRQWLSPEDLVGYYSLSWETSSRRRPIRRRSWTCMRRQFRLCWERGRQSADRRSCSSRRSTSRLLRATSHP